MTEDDIKNALDIIHTASKGPAVWTADPADMEEAAIARFLVHYRLARAATGSEVLHQVDVPADDGGAAFCMAVTGNGPTSRANARYIAGSLNPVAGWEASLREVRRLRREVHQLLSGTKLRHA